MANLDINLEQFKRAQSLYFAKSFDEAERVLEPLFKANYEPEQTQMLQAMIYYRRGQGLESRALLEKVIELNPHQFDALTFLARIHLRSFEFDDALKYQKRAIAIRPDTALVYLDLGRIYQGLHELKPAIQAYEKAIKIDPKCGPAYHGIAQALEIFGEDEAAVHQFLKVFELGGKNPSTMIQLAQIYQRQGKEDLANELFDQLQNFSSKDPFEVGREILNSNEVERGAQFFEAAMAKHGRTAEVLSMLGACYQRLGKFDEAVRVLQESLRLKPYSVTYLELILSRKQSADDPIINDVLERLKATNIPPLEISQLHYAAGKFYDDIKQFDQAAYHFTKGNQIQYGMMQGFRIELNGYRNSIKYLKNLWTKGKFASYKSKGNSSKMPILIVGMIRSGTTLAEQIISSHPKVAAGGELHFLGRRSIGLMREDSSLNEDRIWETIPLYLEHLRHFAQERPRATDKMPQNFVHLGFFHAMFPEAKIVHCTRDKRDVYVSIYNTYFSYPVNFAHDWDNIKGFYEGYEDLMDHWKKVIPSQQLFNLSYEELLTDRESVLRRLMEFLDLEWDDSVMHHEDRGHAILTPSNWQARQPLYSSSKERWRNYAPYYPIE